MQSFVHYFLHLAFPLMAALIFYREHILKVYGIFLLTMLIDLDHLLADPVFDPNRCSIGFHPLHSYWAIGIYLLLLLPARTRIAGIGLLMHMAADTIDCMWMHNCCG
jgi:hypothetical protein